MFHQLYSGDSDRDLNKSRLGMFFEVLKPSEWSEVDKKLPLQERIRISAVQSVNRSFIESCPGASQ
jgi:hypothetical protein